MGHLVLLGIALAVLGCRRADTAAAAVVPDAGARAELKSLGPRLISNATSTPLIVSGARLVQGATLLVGAPAKLRLPLEVLDSTHAFTRFPAGVELGIGSEAIVDVTLEGGDGRVELRLINDTRFPDLVGMTLSNDGAFIVAISHTEDVAYVMSTKRHEVSRVAVGDGPSALAAVGPSSVIVAHSFSPTFMILDLAATPPAARTVPGPALVSGLLVDGDRLFVAEHVKDTVSAHEVDSLAERWRTPVAPNPKAMTMTAAGLVVGSLQTGEVELLDRATGKVLASSQPAPGTQIVGGTTAAFSKYVMNGKAPRALVSSKALGRVFLSSIGPNIGPNPEKMEVSMNGGVASLRVSGPKSIGLEWERHLGFGAGVTDALAFDEKRQLVFAADPGLGVVRIIDARKLAGPQAASALVQEIALPPPARFPLVRPEADFNVKGRAGPSLHSGPKALAMSKDGAALFVLNRFTGTVAHLDVTSAASGKGQWKGQWPLTDVLGQKTRRLGQILYFADLGRTAMSCDACHLEGHGEGVLFEKTNPLRIYRSTTVRGSRETPPYFTPASTHSMGETSKIVGSRNRYQNPQVSPEEIEALTLYSSLIPTLPNPFASPSGAPSSVLALPDGTSGSPARGLLLFEGKAECSRCHPSPLYTLDQDLTTRGRFIDVGTPQIMPLRAPLQDPHFEGFGTPSLNGAWDVFPMMTTGLAGLAVSGERVVVETRFPLRAAVERWAPKHGRADLLSADERNDLLAWIMSL
jgi:hypothetical protein